jgi:predicted small secreted protein
MLGLFGQCPDSVNRNARGVAMTPKKLIILGVIKLAVIAVAVGIVFSMYGCNTVRGIGQDLEKAGGAIQRSTN